MNSTKESVSFPVASIKSRTSLFNKNVSEGAVFRYGSYGDKPGDLEPVVPREFGDAMLPPYSVNVLR